MDPAAEIIWRYLESEKDNLITDLKELSLIESPSTDPLSQRKAFEFLNKKYKELNFFTIQVPGKTTGGYFYARPNERIKHNPVQIMVGHCDTVWPQGTLDKMPVKINNGQIKGPGVYDMKGGLLQMIYAIKTMQALKLKTEVCPVVFINSDEEIGSFESTSMIRCLAKISDRAFILEPSVGYDGKLKTTRKGVGKFTVKIHGKAAHAGLDPEKGASAIVELSHIIQKLFALNDPENGISVNVGMIDGGTRPNVIAPESNAVIDVRIPTVKDAEFITSEILSLKPENPAIELIIEGRIGRPPMEATDQNRALWSRAKNAAERLAFELEETAAGGGSDGNTTSQYTATLDGLGATGDGAHALHEFAFVDKLVERTALLTLLLLEPCLIIPKK
jgi:glutamate carboxypeptidase